MRLSPLLRFPGAWGLLLLSANLIPAAEFLPLGFGVADCVSENGSVVAGQATYPPDGDWDVDFLYRWTRETGAEVRSEDEWFRFLSMSGDGSTIVASRFVDSNNTDREAIRITDEEVYVLPTPAGYHLDRVRISQDGTTMIGYAWLLDDSHDRGVFRWTDDGGFRWLYQYIVGEEPSFNARGISATGDVVVGNSVRWTEEHGAEELPLLSQSSLVSAYGVSSDGRWTVGLARIEGLNYPARWDGLSSPERLEFDDRFRECIGWDVNTAGNRVVGNCMRYVGDTTEDEAALWTQETGMVPLQDVLVNDYGLGEQLEGWWFTNVLDITDDGRFVVGHGLNPDGQREGFLVDLSPNLPGDFNADGHLDTLDIDELSDVVREGSHPRRFDVTDDGLVTGDDRVAWVHQLKITWFGDANLDGEFNSGDFTHVFQLGLYETGEEAGWDAGDWDGDGYFGSSDFVTAFQDGGYEQGPRQDVASVPEPTSALLFVIGLIGVAACRRRPQN